MQQATLFTQFDAAASNAAKTLGMVRAADKRSDLLARVQSVAVEVAQRLGNITADDVTFEMCQRDSTYRPADLGNAAGSIFKGSKWRWTGTVLPARRLESHGRMLKVWRLRR